MNEFASHAREFTSLLAETIAHARSIHAIVLVDQDGLPMASTLGSNELEEGLGATTTDAARWLRYAVDLCSLGAAFRVHVVARERQLFLVPVHHGVWLAALCDPQASPETVTTHLLVLARDIVVCELSSSLSPVPAEGSEVSP
jgi:predicted regulator of Ras-like GTPase activity (Roadblock/LC7/MglB family)